MSQAERTIQFGGAKYFGETSPRDLKNLEINAARAKPNQQAKAASYLEQAFSGMKTAWFGGWALRLRGSHRETHDLDFLVLVPSVVEIRNFWPNTVGIDACNFKVSLWAMLTTPQGNLAIL
jgi:hypothetical protein